jgi:hypothetical protein
MAKAFGATRRDSGVRSNLGAAARTGGGGAATVAKVANFLARGGGPKANFVNKAGRLNSARPRGAAPRGKGGGAGGKES